MVFIKYKYKLIRKLEMDFWCFSYYRLRRQKLFIYLKKVFTFNLVKTSKILSSQRRKFYLKVHKVLKKKKFKKNRFFLNYKFTNPFLKKINNNEEKSRLRLNYYLLYGYRNLKRMSQIYRRLSFRKVSQNDTLIGMSFAQNSKNKLYIQKKKSLFIRQQYFFKKITLFYNQFDLRKLKRLGLLASKSQAGGLLYFLFKLESRLDSMILRMNLGSKFYIRHFIKAKNVLVGNKIITYVNYEVKKNQQVTFIRDKLSYVYKKLIKSIQKRKFFTQPPYYLEINYRILIFFILPNLIDSTFVPYPFLNSSSKLTTGLHTVLFGC